MATSAVVLGSELTLALYPILIKTVPTTLFTQILSRLLVYSGLGYFFASSSDVLMTWGTVPGVLRSMSLGVLTLLHIGSSYYAFQQLTVGASMSLFYTYPIWNLVISSLFFGETITLFQWFLVGLGFVGVLLIASATRDPTPETKEPYNWKGLLAGLLAAFTETGIYFAVKRAPRPSPFYAVLELYPAALLYLLPLGLFWKLSINSQPAVWARLLSFNTLVGFLGYCLRFYAIPRVPTLIFSVLSFVGVLASFGWGYLFVNERPSWTTLLGGILIGTAAGFSTLQ